MGSCRLTTKNSNVVGMCSDLVWLPLAQILAGDRLGGKGPRLGTSCESLPFQN
jgi:hypothetical protein